MIRYLKYIVIVFGSIGIAVGGFFAYQNRVDLSHALEYRKIIDYEYLQKYCLGVDKRYFYPCLKDKYIEYLEKVSLTGTNIGLRMMFSVIEDDKANVEKFESENLKNLVYTLNYLEVNNLTMDNAYRRYFGLPALYGGFLSSLNEYYPRAFRFSEDLIAGMESPNGLDSITDSATRDQLDSRFQAIRENYYQIKQEALDFIEKETARIQVSNK